jgi:hypothetical protein
VELHFRDVGLRDVCRRGLPGVPGLPVRCTTVVQTAADALRTWSEWDSVSLLDAALSRGDLPANWPDAIEERIYRMRGAVAARKRLALADGRSESPLETRVRLIAAACERAPDALQYEVHDARGILLGRADMAWHRADGRLLVAECDGRMWHEAPQAVFRDRHRTNAFSGVGGIDVVRFTWADTARPAYIRRVLDQHLDGRWSRQHAPRAG